MNKLIKQLNKFLAIFTLMSILPFVPTNHANAGFLDWFSGTDNEASVSQTFGQLASFLSVADSTINDTPKERGLPIIQNNSLTAISAPPAAKTPVEIKNASVNSFDKLRVDGEQSRTIKNVMTVLATAYSSTPDQTDSSPFITAWNTRVRDGIVAANFLPFGTKIKIPDIYGDKIFVVEDRMNRRYWHVVDVWFPDRASAKEFGVKRVTIQILES